MKRRKTFLLLASAWAFAQAQAQFVTRPDFFSPTGVANDGSVAGYLMQAGPYSIWNPDQQTSIDIGGIAPGNGVGGQARFSTDGNFISGSSAGSLGAALSIYDRTTGQWTPMADLGFPVDNTTSGGYAISGDGSTVVGNSWADTTGGYAYTHAIASNGTTGVTDLGTLFFGRSTRANAVNADGSVVVGWQDFNGPWKSAVWRRNPNGSYAPNQYILLNAAGDSTDEFNQMGECSAVSADGEWIGGYGDYANNGDPWIWQQDSGVINLGHLPITGTGYTGAMNADASIIVGWFDGEMWGDPMTPFIWTRSGGLQDLNSYITDVLGIDLGDQHVNVANAISSDGRYIAGWGTNNVTFSTFAYRLDLGVNTGIHHANSPVGASVYPNPTSGRVVVNSAGMSVLSILRADGTLVSKVPVQGDQAIDLGKYAAGVYTFIFNVNGNIRTARVVKY
ncbi:MAG: T9SS type A sorting domain-containing protein [Bacteroidetes bacterium]|nr:T9SS type A sorting domain-containing protein [Bacteroidota bacterium]